MFREIVSNLSLSPAASTHLAFYWRRLKHEQLTRQLSVVMALVLVAVQVATIIAPPDAANAAGSSNDLFCGGLGTQHPQHTLLTIYDNDSDSCGHGGWHQFFDYFGISRNDLANTTHGTVHSDNHAIKSVGRNHYFSEDVAFKTGGSTTYYMRPLYLWDNGKSNTDYPALIGHNKDGKWFALLDGCGNISVVDITPTPPSKPTPTPQPTPPPTPQPTPPPTPQPTPTPTPVTVTTTPPPAPVPGYPSLTSSKTAMDLPATGGPSRNADGTLAAPGDTIEYSLITNNTGTATQSNYVVSDDISDILEYAYLLNPGGGTLNGGVLSWPAVAIGAGKRQIDTFEVKIKNPLPTTPSPATDPLSYDFKMQNVYGNQITVYLSKPVPNQVQTAAATLPQTGPGTDSLVLLVLVAGIAYFYFRNRQLVLEVSMLRGDHYGNGGR